MQLTTKQKRILRWVGYPLVGLVSFIMALHWTFPYSRVVDRYVVESLSGKYEVSYREVERGLLPGSMAIRGLALRSYADDGADDTDGDGGGTNLYFKEVEIDLSILALIGGSADVDFAARIGGGSITGNVRVSGSALSADINTKNLPLASLGGVKESVGLPMSGGLDASVDIDLPEYRWDRLDGRLKLSCPGCTIGDGETKIKPRAPPGRRMSRNAVVFAGEGLTVPELQLGNLAGTLVIKDGRGKIDDFSATSDDGELALFASLRFTRELSNTRFESGCMKFRLTDELKKREPNFGNLPQFMKISPEPDGFSNVKLKGLLKAMRWIPTKKCDAGGSDPDERSERAGKRPVTRPRLLPKSLKPDDDEDKDSRPGMAGRPAQLSGAVKPEPDDADRDTTNPEVPEPRTSGPRLTPQARPDDVGKPGLLRKVDPEESAEGEDAEGEDAEDAEDADSEEGEDEEGEGNDEEVEPEDEIPEGEEVE